MNPVVVASEKALALLNRYHGMDINDMVQIESTKTNVSESSSSSDSSSQSSSSPSTSSSAAIHETFQSISKAGEAIAQAWDETVQQQQISKKKKNIQVDEKNDDDSSSVKEDDFRAAYMSLVTDAFSDELDAMRSGKQTQKEQNAQKGKRKKEEETFNLMHTDNSASTNNAPVIDMELLVNILESGMDMFTKEEQQLMMMSSS